MVRLSHRVALSILLELLVNSHHFLEVELLKVDIHSPHKEVNQVTLL